MIDFIDIIHFFRNSRLRREWCKGIKECSNLGVFCKAQAGFVFMNGISVNVKYKAHILGGFWCNKVSLRRFSSLYNIVKNTVSAKLFLIINFECHQMFKIRKFHINFVLPKIKKGYLSRIRIGIRFFKTGSNFSRPDPQIRIR